MATMVPQPYVNHVPTVSSFDNCPDIEMTGGVGYDEVSKFYQNHFIFSNPPDMKLSPISRTVGTDRIVDELILSFTHSTYKAFLDTLTKGRLIGYFQGFRQQGK